MLGLGKLNSSSRCIETTQVPPSGSKTLGRGRCTTKGVEAVLPAGVDPAVGGAHDGELDGGLAPLVVDGLVDVLAVLEPEYLWLRAPQGLAGHLEGVPDVGDLLSLGDLGAVGEDGRRHVEGPALLVLRQGRRELPRVCRGTTVLFVYLDTLNLQDYSSIYQDAFFRLRHAFA